MHENPVPRNGRQDKNSEQNGSKRFLSSFCHPFILLLEPTNKPKKLTSLESCAGARHRPLAGNSKQRLTTETGSLLKLTGDLSWREPRLFKLGSVATNERLSRQETCPL